ncbi:MAG: hypothetical protein UX10_C0026G0006 [Candidatus Magasanikbacteria bacterium GW2011_GWA2_45_39]|uniref:NHL repeat containing protein n=1 Tax=Candidatus Magasanikbacteria bacterium GW2011_GWA2_45_39 TaxID=1619041 RepID=A0A0G1PMQ8_9BACT|nr:MAG: hypothetical protein UX10_C0026G0006 [Candidatus Magasanikbacteria bacterium GW2011_GWA2_45_39]HBW73865.1 hypothetical protein [Candidatus Magasanikbacteria bacterium]
MASLFKQIAKNISAWIACIFVSLLISAFALPWVFDTVERVTNTTLPYEGTLRLSLLFAHGILLAGACIYLLIRGTRHGWYLWIGFTLSFISLAIIFFGDTDNRLMNEYSWIRYTTSALLFGAGLYGLYHARETHARKQGVWITLLLAIIGAAFIYAGLDELAQIHEKIGVWAGQTFQVPPAFGDWITLIYALVGIGCVGFIFYKGRAQLRPLIENSHFITLFAYGAIVYFISTLFDTTDFAILGWLQGIIAWLASDGHYVAGDAWYLVWAPRNFLNSLEEVFEHTAALLFLLAFFFLAARHVAPLQTKTYSTVSKKHRILALTIGGAASLLIVMLIVLSLPDTFPASPLMDGRGAARIAGKTEGLLHTDDLEFNLSWGLLIGNENKGEVLKWQENKLTLLKDPDGVLGQVEAVAADDTNVYASDGTRGVIAEYNTKDARWRVLWSRRDGIYAPEGLAFARDENALYALDESKNSITRLKRGEPIQAWKPTHPLWKAPEGIAFDPALKRLIVTDDVSGAVFAVKFGSSIELLTRVSKAEDVTVLPDGTIYFTNNGAGAIVALMTDGASTRVAQFHRAYRDVQGIAVDENRNIYVIVSDGYNSESIMPSQLFKINPTLRQ